MTEPSIQLLRATVGHKRLWPKTNSFKYGVFYIKTPVSKKQPKTPKLFSFDRFNILSIRTKDHGFRDKKMGWHDFIISKLTRANIKTQNDDQYYLIAHPRVFGYAFNPISYWLVVSNENKLRAVLCEVHNTFKQTHNYLLTKEDGTPINPTDILLANKKLYVSPFNKIEGHYEFSFSYESGKFKSTINYFDDQGRHILNTYMGGEFEELPSRKVIGLLFSYPFMTIMVVARIHWQALKLYVKKVRGTLKYKPKSYENNQTTLSKKIK